MYFSYPWLLATFKVAPHGGDYLEEPVGKINRERVARLSVLTYCRDSPPLVRGHGAGFLRCQDCLQCHPLPYAPTDDGCGPATPLQEQLLSYKTEGYKTSGARIECGFLLRHKSCRYRCNALYKEDHTPSHLGPLCAETSAFANQRCQHLTPGQVEALTHTGTAGLPSARHHRGCGRPPPCGAPCVAF